MRLRAAEAVGGLILSHPAAADARLRQAAALLQAACMHVEHTGAEPAQLSPWSMLGAAQQAQAVEAQHRDALLSLEDMTAFAEQLLFQEASEEVQVGLVVLGHVLCNLGGASLSCVVPACRFRRCRPSCCGCSMRVQMPWQAARRCF